MPSASYVLLQARIEELRVRFVDFDVPFTRAPNSEELDRIASFKLLVHAEVESFIEGRVLDAATEAVKCWTTVRKMTRATMALFSETCREDSQSGCQTTADFESALAVATRRLRKSISDNNSIKGQAFVFLSRKVGIFEDEHDPALIAGLNSMGKTRGDVAHNSVGRVASMLGPREEAQQAVSIGRLLDGFDILATNACS